MAFITNGSIITRPQPVPVRVKRILAIGPGQSITELQSIKDTLPDNVLTIGIHHTFPFMPEKMGIKLNYWTWGDPHATVTGLQAYLKTPIESRPKIIIPYWMRDLGEFKKHSGTTPIMRNNSESKFYNSTVKDLINSGEIELISNAVSTKTISKTHEIFSNPSLRFKGDATYFTTSPYDGDQSGKNWTSENKFTSLILPICHYLKADEVYCIGFDNKGTGLNPTRKAGPLFNQTIINKFKLWSNDWQPHHKMKIYNLSSPKYSPNHTFMDTVSISQLYKK
jgi:hypothetical protein